MADVNVEELSSSQQEALQQYIQVTDQDVAEAVPILQRSQWNVQIAIAKFFDGEGPDLVAEAMAAQRDVPPPPTARFETLQDSLMAAAESPAAPARTRTDPAPRIVPSQPVTRRTGWFLSIVMAPIGWGWTATSTLFRTIFYILSWLPAPLRPRSITRGLTTGFKSSHGRRMLLPRDTAARFKREFEEEYGANELPFYEGGLAQAYDLAKKDLKFLLVILLSPEHDETEIFIKESLLDTTVIDFFKDPTNNLVVWGGNVLDSEAYQVGAEYNCNKFPFSALVCLTPREGSTRMGIVKRLAGPLAPDTYVSEIQAAMEKYGGDLDGVRAERAVHEVSRNIRNEQDSAYERSLAIDRERSRRQREAAEAVEAAEREAREQAAAAALKEEKRRQWRAWRATRIVPEPPASDKDAVRVALKLPAQSGAGRVVRRFPQDASLEELYAFVECYGVELDEDEDQSDREMPEDYEHKYAFRVASNLPREVYYPSTTVTIKDKIGRSGNLIVENFADDSEDEGDGDEQEQENAVYTT